MDGSQIHEGRGDGIIYVDDEAERRFIDFVRCRENYMAEGEGDNSVGSRRATHVVGTRVVYGEQAPDEPYAYVEFYTEPPIGFFMTEADYVRVLGMMRKLGWHTIDMG